MIAGIYISQEIFANDILTALKPSLEHDRKHVMLLLQLYGDQALQNRFCCITFIVCSTTVVEVEMVSALPLASVAV